MALVRYPQRASGLGQHWADTLPVPPGLPVQPPLPCLPPAPSKVAFVETLPCVLKVWARVFSSPATEPKRTEGSRGPQEARGRGWALTITGASSWGRGSDLAGP